MLVVQLGGTCNWKLTKTIMGGCREHKSPPHGHLFSLLFYPVLWEGDLAQNLLIPTWDCNTLLPCRQLLTHRCSLCQSWIGVMGTEEKSKGSGEKAGSGGGDKALGAYVNLLSVIVSQVSPFYSMTALPWYLWWVQVLFLCTIALMALANKHLTNVIVTLFTWACVSWLVIIKSVLCNSN